MFPDLPNRGIHLTKYSISCVLYLLYHHHRFAGAMDGEELAAIPPLDLRGAGGPLQRLLCGVQPDAFDPPLRYDQTTGLTTPLWRDRAAGTVVEFKNSIK